MLTGPMVVARDIAHAKIKERLDAGEPMPDYLRDHCVYYAGPAKTPAGYASGSFGPTTAGRMDSYVEQFQAAGGSMVMLAKGNRSRQVTDACAAHGGFYLGSIGGPAARLALDNIKKVDVLEYPELGMEAVWRIEVVDFPAFIVVDDKGNDFFEQVRREPRTPLTPADQLGVARTGRLEDERARAGLVAPRLGHVGGVGLDAEEEVGHDAVLLAGQLAGLAGGERRARALGDEHLLHQPLGPPVGELEEVVAELGVRRQPVDERAHRPVGGHDAVDEVADDEVVEAGIDRERGVPDALPRDCHGVAERGGQLAGVTARRRRVDAVPITRIGSATSTAR